MSGIMEKNLPMAEEVTSENLIRTVSGGGNSENMTVEQLGELVGGGNVLFKKLEYNGSDTYTCGAYSGEQVLNGGFGMADKFGDIVPEGYRLIGFLPVFVDKPLDGFFIPTPSTNIPNIYQASIDRTEAFVNLTNFMYKIHLPIPLTEDTTATINIYAMICKNQ